MGPRLGSRGKVAGSSWCRRQKSCFNWAATWKSRKVLLSLIVPGLGQCYASMGPRLGSRGKSQQSATHWAWATCFNGAATWKSRKVDITHLGTTGFEGFNGAATWKSRKVPPAIDFDACRNRLQWGRDLEVAERARFRDGATERWIASMGPRLGSRGKPTRTRLPCEVVRRFNGAATWKSRKADLKVISLDPASKLQWGRDLEVAERASGINS